jgi:excisionase family DNA binding protein
MADRSIDAAVTNPTAAPILVTVREAGALLGVGRTTTYELVAAGELEVVHIGRSSRIPIESVEAYVRRLRNGQES